MERDFTLVFEHLAVAEDAERLEIKSDELDELAELRRFALELSEPESVSYITT